EAGGQVARERVAGGGVTDGVEDDAALVRRDEDMPASVAVPMAVAVSVVSAAVVCEGGGRAEDGGRDGSGRHGGAGAEEAAPVHTEAAAQTFVRGFGGGGGVGAGGVGVRGHEWPAFSVVAGSGAAGP